jgi:ankyrin repeat protein
MITKEFVDRQFEQLNDPNFDIDTLDKTGRSLLFLACKICDFEKIKKLVSLNCNVHIVDNIGYNCLITMCSLQEEYSNKLEIIKYFIEEHKVDPYHLTNKDESCLYIACKAGNTDIVEYFLTNYSDLLDIKPVCDASCLEISIIQNHQDVFRLLLSKGANVNDMNDETGMSCLMTAGLYRQYEMTKLLIESGAEINLVNFKNKNALYYASYHMHNNDKTILFLLENGSFICDRTHKLLSKSNNTEILRYLVN